MRYEIPAETIRITRPLYCECGKALSKHAVVCRDFGVEFVCTHCHKTLLELELRLFEDVFGADDGFW
jgi:hypothetical protein